MMQVGLPRSWKEEFALAAALKREDVLHHERMAIMQTQSRQRIDEARLRQQRLEREVAAIETAFAPPVRIAEFRTRLDRYDTKTVEALMDNQQAIDTVQERIDAMLGKAVVLPDGRRAFRTIDGKKAFDEHGQELGLDVIDPMSIDEKKPTWEAYRDSKLEKVRLMEERGQLLDYQGRLDKARDRLDKGEITERELKELGDRLDADMPEAVRNKLGLEKPQKDAAQKLESEAPSLPSNMDALMQQTGLAAAGPSLR